MSARGLDDHVTLIPRADPGAALLARRHRRWTCIADPERQRRGDRAPSPAPRAERQFRALLDRGQRGCIDAFDAPMMQAAATRPAGDLTAHVLRHPAPDPGDGAAAARWPRLLRRQFSDPRLAQLFGRYATYVGGSPYASPAVLALIWQAEARGVWAVEGGMHRLAAGAGEAGRRPRARRSAIGTARRADRAAGRAGSAAVHLADGTRLPADLVVFNGDPARAGDGPAGRRPRKPPCRAARDRPRSLSAWVWAFAAAPAGPSIWPITTSSSPPTRRREFDALAAGRDARGRHALRLRPGSRRRAAPPAPNGSRSS